jgi:hypothetical protein
MPRTYSSYKIEQLQDLFGKSRFDLGTLRKIDDELSHRSTPKALSLQREVSRLLEQASETHRPFFRQSTEALRAMFEEGSPDRARLDQIKIELSFRSTPASRALRQEIDGLSPSSGKGIQNPATQPPIYRQLSTSHPFPNSGAQVAPPLTVGEAKSPTPSRVIVECGYCRAANFVHVSDGVQHLSCGQCKRAYVAEFTYGLLRTTFPPLANEAQTKFPLAMMFAIGIAVLVLLILIVK